MTGIEIATGELVAGDTEKCDHCVENKYCKVKEKCAAYSLDDDLINGLRHMADDHECCRGTVLVAAARIIALKEEVEALNNKEG